MKGNKVTRSEVGQYREHLAYDPKISPNIYSKLVQPNEWHYTRVSIYTTLFYPEAPT
jgi:hypothetical protein